jgi:SAM-dependent methyltransferase
VDGASRRLSLDGDHHDELRREYERRFSARAEYRAGVWRILTDRVFQEYVPGRGTVLELGCGWGEFINQIRAARRIGMDLNPDSAARLTAGVELLHQDCSQPWPLADGTIDTVFTSNFFEHLPDKASLARTLRQAFRCLKPGGRLICLGPNIRFLNGRYWDFWDHYVPLTDRSLVEVLELTGFTIERALPRFLPYTMSGARTPPLWALRTYLRLPFVWPIFGEQFLIVGRKP